MVATLNKFLAIIQVNARIDIIPTSYLEYLRMLVFADSTNILMPTSLLRWSFFHFLSKNIIIITEILGSFRRHYFYTLRVLHCKPQKAYLYSKDTVHIKILCSKGVPFCWRQLPWTLSMATKYTHPLTKVLITIYRIQIQVFR